MKTHKTFSRGILQAPLPWNCLDVCSSHGLYPLDASSTQAFNRGRVSPGMDTGGSRKARRKLRNKRRRRTKTKEIQKSKTKAERRQMEMRKDWKRRK